MRKTLFMLGILLSMLVSCSESGNTDAKKCWAFTLKQTTVFTFEGEVMDTMTNETTTTKCGMTATEAKAAAEEMDGVVTQNIEGMSATVTTTVTYEEVEE